MSSVEDEVVENRDGREAAEHGPRRPRASAPQGERMDGAVIGTLIGFTDDGRVPLVLYPGQPRTAAIAAASAVDLHGIHIGRQVVLLFENTDPRRPIITGVLRTLQPWSLPGQYGQVEVDADGERLVVTAKSQLVLRCGRSSITLTKAGKILIQGTYVSHRSSGVMRISGGSVQIN